MKPGQNDRVGFGFRYDDQYKAAVLFTLSLQSRLLYGSRTQLAFRLGDQVQIEASTFARLGITAPFRVGASASYTSVPVNISLDLLGTGARPVASAEIDVYGAQVFSGLAVSESLLFSFALIGEHARLIPIVLPFLDADDPEEDTAPITETFYSGAAFVLADTRDRSFFPSRGLSLFAKLEIADEAFGSGATFQHIVGDLQVSLPVSRSVSLTGRAVMTRGDGSGLPPHYVTFMGGANAPSLLPGRFYPLYGADDQELFGTSAQLAALGIQWEFGDDLFARAVANAGGVDDGIPGSLPGGDPSDYTVGVGFTVGAFTLIGPATITLAGDGLDAFPNVSFSLGYAF